MKFILSILFVFFCSIAFCQQKITVAVKGDSSLEKILPPEMMYAFNEFTNAEIHLKNGVVNSTRININLYTGEILFLNRNNQVMVLAYPDEISRIMVGSSLWVTVDRITGEVIFTKDSCSLVRIKQTSITDARKESGFGGTSGTASAKSITSYTQDNRTSEALAVGEYDFETKISFVLLKDLKNTAADARGFKKLFPEHKKEIDTYLKTNKIKFDSEKDLISFLQVCLNMKK
jgi:hypothetical protein